MAVDEALLEAFAGDPEARPILRVYGWEPAGLSLGRFQPAGELETPPGAEVVRRLSGGAAIYHQRDELTYCVIARYRDLGGAPKPAYAVIHGLLGAALSDLGVPVGGSCPTGPAVRHGLCYASPTDYDLLAGGCKLVGSAQRRKGTCFLQHGSIPLSPHPAGGGTSLSELLVQPPARAELIASLRGQFASRWRVDSCALTRDETSAARHLERVRYGCDGWTSGLLNPR